MADRSVIVRLKAEVSGFQAAMAASGASAQKMQADLERMQAVGGSSLGKLATSADLHKEAWRNSGVALLGFGAAAEAGVGLAVKAFADFSSKMAQVQSLSHASASDMKLLTDAALNMGQSIGFSATEVADAEIELVKAGVSVKDIMGGALAGSLTLAAAGQIDVAQATEISTIAMTQFGLAGKDIPHVADLLAAGADKALGGVSDLGWALKSGGLVAHQFGISLDDTVGTLALFAQNGLMGEAAGTDLRQMLLKLAAPSKTASDDMKSLGISIYDQQKHFVGMSSLAGQLHDKMGKLSEAERNAMEAHIFGARSIVGANILYQAGAQGVQDWINSVNDSGFAAKQAAGKMDSLSGDMNKLQAAWGTSMIEMGSKADGFLRPIVQNITGVIHGFEGLSDSTKGTILGFAATAGAVALVVGGFLSLAPKVFDTIQGFKQLAADDSKIPGVLGGIGKAAGVAGLAFTGLQLVIQQFNSAQPSTQGVEAFTQAIVGLKSNSGAIDDVFKNIQFNHADIYAGQINNIGDALAKLTHQDMTEALSSFGATNLGIDNGTAKIIDAVKKTDDSFATLTSSGNFDLAAAGFKKVADSAKAHGVGMDEVQKRFPSYFDALQKLANDQKVDTHGVDMMAWAMGKIPDVMVAAGASTNSFKDATGATIEVTKEMSQTLEKMGIDAQGTILDLEKFTQVLMSSGLATLDARDAESAFQQTLSARSNNIKNIIAEQGKFGDALNKTSTDFDLTTKSGQDANAMFGDIMRKGIASAEAMGKAGNGQTAVAGKIKATRDALIDSTTKLLGNKDAATKLTDSLMHIPPKVNINSWMSDQAKKMADQTTGAINNVAAAADALNHKVVTIVFQTDASGFYDPSAGTNGKGAASGSANQNGKKRVFAAGGEVGGAVHGPGTGTSDDIPAWLSNGEHVLTATEVQKMGGQAAVYRFRDMVDKGQAPKFARGGAVFYNSPGHMHESAAAHANRLYREAQAAARARASELAKSASYRYGELNTLSLDDARGQSYATVNQSLSSGYQFSDRLRTVANSGNLPSQKNYLLNAANHADATLRNLWARSDRLGKSLTAAQQRLTDLTQVKTQVASSLRGEFKMSDVVSNAGLFGVPNITDIQAAATAKLGQINAFAGKLNQLQRMGYSGAIVQEVAGMGSAQGAVAADALIGASKTQVSGLNGTYTAMDTASAAAGTYVTNSMFKGGVSVAAGIVAGLQSQESAITRAMTNVGIGMEKALKKALGINSPSRVATDITDNFTGTIIDRQKAALSPISAHATALGHAMVPSKSLFGGSGATAYRPAAPAYQGAPSYQPAASGPTSVTIVNNIMEQSHPVATAHEVTRRQMASLV